MRSMLIIAACAFAWLAAAEDKMPIPKVYQGMGTQKGQWKVDWLERSGGRGTEKMPPSMTICSDNLASHSRQNMQKGAPSSECTHRLLKDTSTEAVVESTCKNRTTTIKTTRENSKALLMEVDSKGGSADTHMKMRYSYLGACREGQATMTMDKNSEQCQKIRAQVAKMDPEKQCARSSQREQCLQQMQAQKERLGGMCN